MENKENSRSRETQAETLVLRKAVGDQVSNVATLNIALKATTATAELKKVTTTLYYGKDVALKELQSEINCIIEENYQQKLRLDANDKMIYNLKNGEREMKADILACRRELDIQMKIISDLKSQLESAYENIQKTKASLKKVQSELHEQQLYVETMQQTNLELSSELELKKEAISDYEIDAKAYQNTIITLEKQLLEYRTCKDNDQLTAYKIRIQDLEQQNFSQQEELYTLKAFIDDDIKCQMQRELEERTSLSSKLSKMISEICDGTSSIELGKDDDAIQAFQTDSAGTGTKHHGIKNHDGNCGGESNKNAGTSPVPAVSRTRKHSAGHRNVDHRDKVSKE